MAEPGGVTAPRSDTRERQPWWLVLLVEWVPLGLLIYLQYHEEINEAAAEAWARLRPQRPDLSDEKLRWHRARFLAGGYSDDGGPALDGAVSRP